MGYFDEMAGLFRTLGLNEDAATAAAVGRYRSEGEARAADLVDEAEDLADQLHAQAQSRPSSASQELAQINAALPLVAENVARLAQGQPARPLPGAHPLPDPVAEAVVPTVAESLRMSTSEARTFVRELAAREVRRGGPVHAGEFLRAFEGGLRSRSREVREVAPR